MLQSQANSNFTLGLFPPPPQNGNLPLTWGYWKTHDGYGPQADAWPTGTFDLGDDGSGNHVIYIGAVDNQGRAASSMTIGGHTYSFADLQTILATPVGGDALMSLGHQLIAAILNDVNGAGGVGTPTGASLILQASNLLSTNHLIIGVTKVKPSTTLGGQLGVLETALDTYNSIGG